MSNRQTSGRSSRASVDRFASVGRLADDLDVGLGVEDHRPVRSGRCPGRRRSARGCHETRPALGSTALTVQPPAGAGPASSVPPSSVARSVMPTRPKPDGFARPVGAASPSSRDGQPHAVGVAGHADLDPGGVAGVPDGVGDRLLRQPVDGGVDRWPKVVEVARRVRRRPAGRAPAPRASCAMSADAALRGERPASVAVAQDADHRCASRRACATPPPR